MNLSKIIRWSTVFIGLIGIAVWVVFYSSSMSPPILAAFIDTGIDTQKAPEILPLLAKNNQEIPNNQKDDDSNGFIDDTLGWNFFNKNDDISDQSGHGTAIAQLFASYCPDCLILPIKITKHGAGILPDDIASAIRYAIQRKAKLIHLAFGVNQGSVELEKAVAEAHAKGILLIVAAGEGIPNPFRPVQLETIFPQAYENLIVVGSIDSLKNANPLLNYGYLLDLSVLQSRKTKIPDSFHFGSSFAAAEIISYVSKILKAHPEYDLKTIRQILRASTVATEFQDPQKVGYGIFDYEKLFKISPAEITYRIFHKDSSIDLDFNADQDIQSIDASWICQGNKNGSQSLNPNPLKKGRAYFSMKGPPGQDCIIQAQLQFSDGKNKELSIHF